MITISTEDVYKAKIESQLSGAQSDLQTQCTNNMGPNAPVVVLKQTVTIVYAGSKVCITVVFYFSYSCCGLAAKLIQVKPVWLIMRKVDISVHFTYSSADAIRICIFKQLPNYNIQQFFLYMWMSINVLPLQ